MVRGVKFLFFNETPFLFRLRVSFTLEGTPCILVVVWFSYNSPPASDKDFNFLVELRSLETFLFFFLSFNFFLALKLSA